MAARACRELLIASDSRTVPIDLKCLPMARLQLRLEIATKTRYSVRDPQGSSVVHNEPDPNQPARPPGQILTFQLRRRGKPQAAPASPPHAGLDEGNPLDDLARYEDEDRNIDYRHRMLMNVIAVLVVSLLVGLGVWIADTIAAMEKAQDCIMQGRQNCAPIKVEALKH